MKKFKPLAPVTGKIFKISPKRPINTALLWSLGCNKEESGVRMAYRPAIPLAAMPPVRLPANYMVRLACSSPKLHYRGKDVPAAGLESRPAKSQAECKRVYRLANKSYLSTWGPKVAGFYLCGVKEFEKKYLSKTRSLIMFKKGKPAAYYSLLKFPRAGKTLDLVAWHNPIGRLSAAEMRSAWHQAAAWLDKASKHRLVVGLDSFDKESIKAFAGLGFKVDRVRVVRL